eukprot:TRINITY_DN30237_c0_g1_i1.p1 TRINITY_DN30237_c0_g1~~TRINITY_DN30237_c0_g1_i1.p1  ORF type:complete len:500 (+),score=56.21 TRINITY_DN30237_c0_g1_i1:437-1936(+)
MGNATGVTGGWLFSGQQEQNNTLVVLKMHCFRNIGLGVGEDLCGFVSFGTIDEEVVAKLTKHETARILVGADSVLAVEFRSISSSVTSSVDPRSGRSFGEVRLPLEHVARRCGRGLYHMWFPLCAPWLQRQDSAARGSQSDAQMSVVNDSLDHFDRSLRNAARDPRWPMVCLSLCHADDPVAGSKAIFTADISPENKADHFAAMLHSHAQQARLLQALYRIVRAHQQKNRDPAAESSVGSGPTLRNSRSLTCIADSARDESSSGMNEAKTVSEDDILRLQNDISAQTREANARINQASDAIKTLKERLGTRQVEHDRIARETQRCNHDADMLEIENERLELTLERCARAGVRAEDPEEDVNRLRRDVGVLKEQKEAMMLILDDLYGKVGQAGVPLAQAPPSPAPASASQTSPSSGSAYASATAPAVQTSLSGVSGSAAIGGGGYGAPPVALTSGSTAEGKSMCLAEGAEQDTWTNLLPRPSELFASDFALFDSAPVHDP